MAPPSPEHENCSQHLPEGQEGSKGTADEVGVRGTKYRANVINQNSELLRKH